ncbi:ABC transporter ATP-binding protein [Thermus aquaticus]|jgi:branched-chain amino acid transport system ATP-binding protein|uniref:Branched-chain amino acid transport ATP-binding protein LivG n=1 Tax=Thermus aquaticus (strain ATCC BAA-2747 / Y51MC23) TaxID=498848 RepID=A0ABM5VKU1_THEA5|nr:ABC transporter ATP-binding protein [Thermus aquaticus]ALJ90757.1 branched-chain amino acid transport ATP-binding protein LivG [Thermus aquaticus Y51MC23]
MDLLEAEGISKRFGGLQALYRVDFRVKPREIVGLIGPNGAGKTTLLRVLLGIHLPDEGRVRFQGRDITRLPTWERVRLGLAATFQNPRPLKRLPVIANVLVAAYGPRGGRRGDWVKRAEARALDALEFVGIADKAKEPASVLSQGELKRLEIARALATEPELLILDEPFAGLTPVETELLAKSLARLRKGGRFGRLHSEGCAMVIIEHKLSELFRIADRVVVLNFGEVLAEGSPEEVLRDPRVVEAYLGEGAHA